ncbi:MAG: ABC transporter permease [Sandaracinaceae bacterium]|nr:ABC transporter permease [Sandaracinaceae bacterium]
MRSSLTTLGIVIGVAAVITMVTIGEGATQRVTGDIASLGDNLIFVVPGTPGHGRRGGMVTSAHPLERGDTEAIRELSEVGAASALAARSVRVVSPGANWLTMVNGTDESFHVVRRWAAAEGRGLTEADVRSASPVCVVGATVKSELFGAQSALGASIRIHNMSCEIVGVLASRGRSTFGDDQDNLVLMPLTTFQRRIAGNDDVAAVFVSAVRSDATTRVKQRIEALMRQRRRIRAGDEDDFVVQDMREIANLVQSATGVLTALLGAIAAISLLVGGIGIMNIMLVSVTERTREIGIRMAIGARGREVLMQFLVEAIVLSLFGGGIGVVLGFVVSYFVAQALEVPFVPVPSMALIAFAFSAAVGVAFGFFPARKAARLDPIEALRHE